MSASPAYAASPGWDNENLVPEELIARLYRVSESAILEATAALSPQQRANLAAFCYRKAHMHSTGLAIAATCELATLVQAHGTALGSVLFAQSRERSTEIVRTPGGHRPKVTLAQRPQTALMASFDLDDDLDTDVDADNAVDAHNAIETAEIVEFAPVAEMAEAAA